MTRAHPEIAVLFVAHGSRHDRRAAATARALATMRAGLGRIDSAAEPDAEHACEVAVACWAEQPSLREAMLQLAAPTVVVVPVFAAAGFFTGRVVPRELGLPNGPGEDTPAGPFRRGSRTVVVAPPLGASPRFADAIAARWDEARAAHCIAEADPSTALLVIGHGTPRSSRSGETVHRHVAALAQTGRFACVAAAFLDQQPLLSGAIERLPPEIRRVVAVPAFVGAGPHLSHDLPAAIGLPDHDGGITSGSVGSASRGDVVVHYTDAAGTHPAFAAAASEAIERALDRLATEAPVPLAPDPWHDACSPEHVVCARRALVRAISAAAEPGPVELAELRIERTDRGWQLRHRADTAGEAARRVSSAALWRLAATDAAGDHRSIRAARGLPRGWHWAGATERALWFALEALAPGALANSRFAPPLPTIPLAETAARLGRTPPAPVDALVASVCTVCTRSPHWHGAQGDALPPRTDAIACREACPWVVAESRR